MEEFQREVLSRLPLAEAVWTLLRYVISPEFAAALFERYRGTGYEGEIRFGTLVELVAEALLEHAGSGRRSFERGRADGRLTATVRAAYGKLGRVRLELSQAFLAEATLRLGEILATQVPSPLPESLRGFHVVAIDGKKIKKLAKRLQPLRNLQGQALGGKGVVALWLNTQLAVAMEASPDGEANDAPLAPALVAQVQSLLPGPLLYVADRQFCDLSIPRKILEHEAHFVIRFTKKMRFFPETTRAWTDAEGRAVCEEWGWLGVPRDDRRLFLRRITLHRPGEEDVSLVTDLVDCLQVPGQDLLDVYLQRWTIERVFQQVTEVFRLDRLIGSTPQGALFQFALCLLLYNLIQVIRTYVAQLEARAVATISSELMFRDVRDQLTAGALLLDRQELVRQLDQPHPPEQVRSRLRELLRGQWSPTWLKSPPKKPPRKVPRKTPVPGGHSSAWKLIQAAKTSSHPHPP